MPGPRGPFGPAVVTLIVIDAVLVLTFAFMFGQRGLPSPPPGIAERAVSTSSSATSSPTVEPVRFASPTRNIACTIAPDAANCEISQFMYDAPTLDGCSADVGHEIEVTPEGAHWVCRTASPPPTPGPEVTDLDWGDSVTEYGYTCSSENDGVTCVHDESGSSFHLARREATLT